MSQPSIRNPADVVPIDGTRRQLAVEALTRAFRDDPMWACVLPDAEARAEAFRSMWDALIGVSRVYGAAYTTSLGEGAACWVSPGQTQMTLWKMIRTGMRLPRSVMGLPKDARDRFFTMMRFIDAQHEEQMGGMLHWHLWALGVAPECQGRGIGSALLRPILDQADTDSVACYLETQTEQNVAFYQRRGFGVLHRANEPVCALPVWFMIREARR